MSGATFASELGRALARQFDREGRRGGRDRLASMIAERVYRVTLEVREAGEEQLPLAVFGPLMTAATFAAPGALQLAGFDGRDQALVDDMAAYLVAGFREMVVFANAEHFLRWCQDADRLERTGGMATGEGGLDVGREHDGDAAAADADGGAADGGAARGESGPEAARAAEGGGAGGDAAA